MFSRGLHVLGVEKKLSILVSRWKMVLVGWHLIHFRLFTIDLYQRLRNTFFFTICSYGNHIYHYFDGAATLTKVCHTNVLGNVVHTKVTKVAVEFYKAQMISALVLLLLNLDNKVECVVAIITNEIVVVEVLL